MVEAKDNEKQAQRIMLVFLATRIGDNGGTGLDIQWIRQNAYHACLI
jgi:hypothetical protein